MDTLEKTENAGTEKEKIMGCNATDLHATDFESAAEFEAAVWGAGGVEKISESEYQIIGKPYTIRFCGRGDGDARLWECDCPAGRHGKRCKHVTKIAQLTDFICDECGYE